MHIHIYFIDLVTFTLRLAFLCVYFVGLFSVTLCGDLMFFFIKKTYCTYPSLRLSFTFTVKFNLNLV